MMNKQYGFYFDAGRCVGCRSCEIACRITNETEAGIKWREISESWSGEFPDVKRQFASIACMHCEEPSCMDACSAGAIYKRDEDGIVLVDQEKCTGCRECFSACPWDVPKFGADGKMQKCDYCVSTGRPPACTESCPAEALFSGPLDELIERAGAKGTQRMEGFTKPAVIVIL